MWASPSQKGTVLALKYHFVKMWSLRTIKLLCREQTKNKLTMEAHVDKSRSPNCENNYVK